MTLNEAKKILLDIDRSGKSKGRYKIVVSNKELMNFINSQLYGKIANDSTITEKCYWILHDIRSYPKCFNKKCNNIVTNFKDYNNGYYKYCCHFCSTQCEDHKNEIRKIFQKQFGKNSPLSQDWVLEKSHNCEARSKYDKTCLLHGYITPMQNEIIKNQWIKSNLVNNGGIGWQVEKTRHKAMSTNISLYGVPHACQNHDIFRKICKKWYYSGMYFGSSYELYFYMYLKRKNISFIYQPQFPELFEWNGIKHKIFPDFLLTDRNEYIDTKGEHFIDDNGNLIIPFEKSKDLDLMCEAKTKFMIDHHIKIYVSKDLKNLGIDMKNSLYLRRFCKFLDEYKLFYDKDISYINHSNIKFYMQDAMKVNNI